MPHRAEASLGAFRTIQAAAVPGEIIEEDWSACWIRTELALWLAAFLGFLVAEAGLVVRRDWLRPLLAAPVTALITIGLVIRKPPVWVDGLVTIGGLVGLWKAYRPAARSAIPGTGKRVHGETR